MDDDASVVQVSAVVQGAAEPLHTGAVVTCVAVENRTRVPTASVPTAAETLFAVALIDHTAVAPLIALTAAPKHVDGPDTIKVRPGVPTVFAVNAQKVEHDGDELIRNWVAETGRTPDGPHMYTGKA